MHNLHIYPSTFEHESRILKETLSLSSSSLFDQIHIVAMWRINLAEHEVLDDKRTVWRLKSRLFPSTTNILTKILQHIEWQVKILWHFHNFSVACVNCHSLSVLFVGVLCKLLWGCRLIYDTHELETESAGSTGIRKLLAKLTELVLVRYVDVIFTVNESISQWYRTQYVLQNVYTVRNVPYRQEKKQIDVRHSNFLKDKLNIKPGNILFLYLGVLGKGRGLDILLDAFTQAPPHLHIVFIGFGTWATKIKSYEQSHKNIHFHEAVSPDQVYNYARCADIGISLIENICLSYYLSLPNKVFEYILSDLPIIVSDFPEMRKVVNEARCGWKTSVDKDSLLNIIAGITWDDIAEKRKNIVNYKATLGWQQEEKVMLEVYHNLFRREASLT